MKHLIDPTDLSVNEISEIIALAQDIIANRDKYSEVCRGKKLATLFYEPSTRTRLSFTAAMMELGGNVLGFADAKSSSVSKGETVQDTVRVINCFADIIAMRHKVEGAPLAATDVTSTPIINAGDGSHSHPTQTMTDLLTIKRELGTLNNLTIGLVGDLKYGRTVHSLIKAMTRYENTRFVLISPPELALPDYIKSEVLDRYGVEYRESADIESVIGDVDILYMTRVQQERFTDLEEYERVKDCFVLDAKKMDKSATFPRISPDGRYLLFGMGEYGCFHIWHKDADLCLIDLETMQLRNLKEVNSSDVESYHAWSSNGRWMLFTSRRDDGGYTHLYIAYFDKQGKAYKPFILPQRNPYFYNDYYKSYNVPEFMIEPVAITPQEFARYLDTDAQAVKFRSQSVEVKN